MLRISPKNGAAITSGSTLAVQCARHFTSTVSASMWRSADSTRTIERAVLAVGLEQPVEAEQRGKQRADPQHRRADAGEHVEVGPEREGDRRDDGEEEQHAGQRPAAGTGRKSKLAEVEG